QDAQGVSILLAVGLTVVYVVRPREAGSDHGLPRPAHYRRGGGMNNQTLFEVLDDYAAIVGISSDTKRLHRICLTHFERFLKHEPTLVDLNDLTVAKFIEWRTVRVSHETLRGDCCKLLALWRWCAGGKRRWIDPPEIKAPQPVYR